MTDHSKLNRTQLNELKKLWIEVAVPPAVWESNKELIIECIFISFETMVKGVISEAHISREDCQWQAHQIVGDNSVRFKLWWNPQHSVCEFYLGPMDGRTAVVQHLNKHYKGVKMSSPRYVQLEEDNFVAYDTVHYELKGWNPNTRCWIFEPV